jgi:hypothetical protein
MAINGPSMERKKRSQNNPNMSESGTVNSTLNVTDFKLVKMLIRGYPLSKP